MNLRNLLIPFSDTLSLGLAAENGPFGLSLLGSARFNKFRQSSNLGEVTECHQTRDKMSPGLKSDTLPSLEGSVTVTPSLGKKKKNPDLHRKQNLESAAVILASVAYWATSGLVQWARMVTGGANGEA